MNSTMIFLKTMTMMNSTTMDPNIVNTKTTMMKNMTIKLKKMALKTMDMKTTIIPHQTNDNQWGYHIGILRTIVSKRETHHSRARHTLVPVTIHLHQMTILHCHHDLRQIRVMAPSSTQLTAPLLIVPLLMQPTAQMLV